MGLMTDRFEWLEFDERQAAHPDAAPARDVRQLMLDAWRAYTDGDYEAALRLYSQALKKDKARLDGWAGQVRCLVRLGEMREAQSWAARACQLFPSVPQLESTRAYALASSGLIAQAMAASDTALELAERSGLSDPRIWHERAVCLLVDGNRATAAFCFDKVRETCPNEPEWEQEIGIELLAIGDNALALSAFNAVVDRHPERAYAWLLVAQAAHRLGLGARAAEALERAERLRPAHPAIARERARVDGPWLVRMLRKLRSR